MLALAKFRLLNGFNPKSCNIMHRDFRITHYPRVRVMAEKGNWDWYVLGRLHDWFLHGGDRRRKFLIEKVLARWVETSQVSGWRYNDEQIATCLLAMNQNWNVLSAHGNGYIKLVSYRKCLHRTKNVFSQSVSAHPAFVTAQCSRKRTYKLSDMLHFCKEKNWIFLIFFGSRIPLLPKL